MWLWIQLKKNVQEWRKPREILILWQSLSLFNWVWLFFHCRHSNKNFMMTLWWRCTVNIIAESSLWKMWSLLVRKTVVQVLGFYRVQYICNLQNTIFCRFPKLFENNCASPISPKCTLKNFAMQEESYCKVLSIMLILYEFDQNRHEQFLYDGLHLAMDNLKMQHPDYTIIPGRIKI